MSMYSDLAQVLAAYAAKINGLLTGYDGTEYSTPGEAVRTQINNLHVLIGDEPGTAIVGTSVSYDGSDSGLSADNMQGAVDELSGDISNTNERLLNVFPTDTASGSVASFSDGADGVQLKSLVIDINPVQDTSQGDPSPTNVCPISGHTQAVVTRTGVNVWDEEWEVGGYAGSTGAAWDTNTRIRSKTTNYISVLPNTTYYVNMPSGTSMYLDIMFYNAGKTFISSTNPNAGTTFTTPSDARFMRFASGAAYGTTYNHDISINYPSTDHDYHAHAVDTTSSITFPSEAGTVYGGTLDVTNGVLTVDMAIVDLGTLTWALPSAGAGKFYSQHSGTPLYDKQSEDETVCSQYKYDGLATTAGAYYGANGTLRLLGTPNSMTREVYIVDESKSEMTATQFKEAMSGVMLCYKLATPTVYQLTSHEVESILGGNNIYADTGDSTVVYRADPTLYINKKIAEAISALS